MINVLKSNFIWGFLSKKKIIKKKGGKSIQKGVNRRAQRLLNVSHNHLAKCEYITQSSNTEHEIAKRHKGNET